MNYLQKAKDNAVLKREGFIVSMIMDLGNEADEPYALPSASRSKYRKIDVNDYMTPGDIDSEVRLSFPHYWEVTYTNELEEEEYLRHQGIIQRIRQRYDRVNVGGVSGDRGKRFSGNVSDQKSVIKLAAESLTISTTSTYDMLGLQVYNYWSWLGMADILPRDYTIAVAKAEEIALASEINPKN